MKKIIFIITTLMIVTSFATERTVLIKNFQNLNATNLNSVVDHIEIFSEIKKLTEAETELTVLVLKTLVFMEVHDKSNAVWPALFFNRRSGLPSSSC